MRNKIKFRNIKSLDYCGISIFKECKSQWTDEASHVDGVLQNQRMEKPQNWNLRYQIHSGQLSSDTPLSKIYIYRYMHDFSKLVNILGLASYLTCAI